MFDYYYGQESEQFSFYRIPKVLFEAESVKGISTDAKVLYGLMLDRMQLSAKNKWHDEYGRVYIYYSVKQIMEALSVSNKTVTKILHELENMVKEVNATQVEIKDQLSDHVYNYDVKEKVFELAEKFDARKKEKNADLAVGKESVLKDLFDERKEAAGAVKPHNSRHEKKAEATL